MSVAPGKYCPLITDFGLLPERQGITRALFLDRDGVLIYDKDFAARAENLELIPGAENLVNWQDSYRLIVITNQSGIARQKFTEEELLATHRRLLEALAEHGVYLDAIFYCPHHPKEGFAPYQGVCDCRKPASGMIRRAAAHFGIDTTTSWMIGDKVTDIQAGQEAGCQTILIGNSPAEPAPTHYFASLNDLENLVAAN